MDKENLYNILFISSIVLALADLYFSLILGQNSNEIFYYGFLLVPVFIIFAVAFYKTKNNIKILKMVKYRFGKIEKKKKKNKGLERLFNLLKKDDYYIDEQTAKDLNLKDIFESIDSTYTTPGEQSLYRILRTPIFNEEEIIKRDKAINKLYENEEVRNKIGLVLAKIGKFKNNDATSILWENPPKSTYLSMLAYVLFVVTLVALGSIPFLGKSSVLPITMVFIINMVLHNSFKKEVSKDFQSISIIGTVIEGAYRLKDIEDSDLNPIIEELKKSKKLVGISKKTATLGRIEGLDVLGDYVKILFLADELSYSMVIKDVNKYREEIKALYFNLGMLDAYIAIASYRKSLKKYTIPEFGSVKLEIVDMIHPLIDEPVSNSINVEGSGMIITGSNMSGKSTFLRTLGVNVLFSQTIITCLCEKYSGPFLKVITSISPDDNIMGGKSYYLAEAEALLRIINETGEVPILCLVDEIFRGTNPLERINAATEILDYLAENNAISIVATHDKELTELTQNHYGLYYFTESVTEKGLSFDFKIRNGVTNTRNAIKLLEFMGYPKEIIENTNIRIENNKN
ncbi:MAG: MutS family DNA mismatch repair protein [Clostridiaceae bacterium]